MATELRHNTTEWRLALWARETAPSAVQELLKRASGHDLVTFALGMPETNCLPNDLLGDSLKEILLRGADVLQYSRPSDRLKDHIIGLMARRGIRCRKEQIFLTTGAQQGLSLLTRLLIDPHSPVLVEELLYPGFRQAIEACCANVVSVPVITETGIDLDALTETLRGGCQPALLYLNSGAHNPLGVTLPISCRERLSVLASEYEVPVIEDDAYGLITYEKPVPDPLRSLNSEMVCYVGSLSKIIAPALRVGWIVAPEWIMDRLSILKESTDLDTQSLGQAAAAALLDRIDLDAHIDSLREMYKTRRDTMLQALGEELSEEAVWMKPTSGFYIWVRLRNEVDTAALAQEALTRARVAFVPGEGFSTRRDGSFSNSLRLSFSNSSPDRIREGIRRLAGVIRQRRSPGLLSAAV